MIFCCFYLRGFVNRLPFRLYRPGQELLRIPGQAIDKILKIIIRGACLRISGQQPIHDAWLQVSYQVLIQLRRSCSADNERRIVCIGNVEEEAMGLRGRDAKESIPGIDIDPGNGPAMFFFIIINQDPSFVQPGLLNDKLNQKFPPFVNLGVLGFNFGMQGVQFTATSTVAENQTLSFPMYVHSIPNNNDNQDIVSMGANAALLTKKVIDNSFEVLSIQLMAIAQAIDYAGCQSRLAPTTLSVYENVRKICPAFVDDRPKYKEQQKLAAFLEQSSPLV